MLKQFEKHIVLKQSQIAIDCLSENTLLSKQQLKKLMQNGAVWLENGYGINRMRRAKKKLSSGNQLHVYYDVDIQKIELPEAILIADEGEYSIWNKPSGMFSQGTKWGDHCTLYRWAELNLTPQRPAFIVHRLDKAANGLMILAHSKKMATILSRMFEYREINKKYCAIVEGCFDEIVLPFKINNKLDGKVAISEIVKLEKDDELQQTKVEIVIKTGRKHQIRRHLSALGYPIVGDRLYQAKASHMNLQLSSIDLQFICPVTGLKKHYKLL